MIDITLIYDFGLLDGIEPMSSTVKIIFRDLEKIFKIFWSTSNLISVSNPLMWGWNSKSQEI